MASSGMTGCIQVGLKQELVRRGVTMKRTWTIIGVGDVPGSFKWYQALFGQPATLPAHDYFGQILDSDGTVLLCLHEWGAHEHPSLMSPDHGTPGNGLLLFFRVEDFALALHRARSLVTRLEGWSLWLPKSTRRTIVHATNEYRIPPP